MVASGDGAESSVKIWQDARVYATLLYGEESVEHIADPQRWVYVHVAQGSVYLNEIALKAGDGAKIQNESRLVLERGQGAEVLVFDMA